MAMDVADLHGRILDRGTRAVESESAAGTADRRLPMPTTFQVVADGFEVREHSRCVCLLRRPTAQGLVHHTQHHLGISPGIADHQGVVDSHGVARAPLAEERPAGPPARFGYTASRAPRSPRAIARCKPEPTGSTEPDGFGTGGRRIAFRRRSRGRRLGLGDGSGFGNRRIVFGHETPPPAAAPVAALANRSAASKYARADASVLRSRASVCALLHRALRLLELRPPGDPLGQRLRTLLRSHGPRLVENLRAQRTQSLVRRRVREGLRQHRQGLLSVFLRQECLDMLAEVGNRRLVRYPGRRGRDRACCCGRRLGRRTGRRGRWLGLRCSRSRRNSRCLGRRRCGADWRRGRGR